MKKREKKKDSEYSNTIIKGEKEKYVGRDIEREEGKDR